MNRHHFLVHARRDSGRGAIVAAVALLAMVITAGGCGDDPSATTGGTAVPANAVQLTFAVEGMHCDGCAAAIRGTVEQLPAVVSCEASFADGRATVLVTDPAAASAIAEAISGLGYRVVPSETGAPTGAPD